MYIMNLLKNIKSVVRFGVMAIAASFFVGSASIASAVDAQEISEVIRTCAKPLQTLQPYGDSVLKVQDLIGTIRYNNEALLSYVKRTVLPKQWEEPAVQDALRVYGEAVWNYVWSQENPELTTGVYNYFKSKDVRVNKEVLKLYEAEYKQNLPVIEVPVVAKAQEVAKVQEKAGLWSKVKNVAQKGKEMVQKGYAAAKAGVKYVHEIVKADEFGMGAKALVGVAVACPKMAPVAVGAIAIHEIAKKAGNDEVKFAAGIVEYAVKKEKK
jgi:hypothetical protein